MGETVEWTLQQLQDHLQDAVDLEMWTIPFYMSAMYSIRNPGEAAYQAILSVVNQEMLHVQLAANLANAYGLSPAIKEQRYVGKVIPHLNFELDHPDPTKEFGDYSAEIGPYDALRLNAMCLIEYPMWIGRETPRPLPSYDEYGSIGQFYQTVAAAAGTLKDHIRPANQVNLFQRFYNRFHGMTVTASGAAGWPQVETIVTAICEQGEGQTKGDREEPWTAPKEFQNTTDDTDPNWSHFQKFMTLWRSERFPEVYEGEKEPPPGSPGAEAQAILRRNYTAFRGTLQSLLASGAPEDFYPAMVTLGGNILNCWKNGAVPRFDPPEGLAQAAVPAAATRAFPDLERVRARRGQALVDA